MNLKAHETQLVGRWKLVDGRMTEDETSKRITALVRHELKEVAVSSGGWDKLFRYPVDNRLWELTYPASGSHGGRPPALNVMSEDAARRKYKFEAGNESSLQSPLEGNDVSYVFSETRNSYCTTRLKRSQVSWSFAFHAMRKLVRAAICK